jgi:molecular chaperone DnaJ
MPITMVQAALGCELEVPTLDGKVKYTVPEGTQSGTTFRLKDKGIPYLRGNGRGDQYVTVDVEIPKNLNAEQRELLEKLGKALGDKNFTQKKKFFKK